METLRRLQLFQPDLPVVMISAQGTAEVAVEAMKGGATDYITKGQDDLVKLDVVVERLKGRVKLAREVEQLRAEVAKKYGMEEIVGDSPAMERVYQLVQKTLRGQPDGRHRGRVRDGQGAGRPRHPLQLDAAARRARGRARSWSSTAPRSRRS